jgi:WD40 repeat protein
MAESYSRASFSPDGRELAVACAGDPVSLWDVSLGKKLRTLPWKGEVIFHVAYSPDGGLLATAHPEIGIKLWEVRHLKQTGLLPTWPSVPVFSPDSQVLAIIAERTVELWSVHRLERIATFEGHAKRVSAVRFSPDGKLLATCSGDKTVRLWDVHTAKELAILRGHEWGVWCLEFSPDGALLASGGGKYNTPGELFLWDVTKALRENR